MTDPIKQVQDLMGQAEDVDLPEGMASGESPFDDGGMDMCPAPPPQHPDEPLPPEADCVGMPLNDYGNGQRFVRHFGQDLLYVPRVGWFTWIGTHWKRDDDQIKVRSMAHMLADKIAAETSFLYPTDRERQIIEEAEIAEASIERISEIPFSDRTDEDRKALRDARQIVDQRDNIIKGQRTAIARRLTHAKNAGNSNAINNFISEPSIMAARELDMLDAAPLEVNCQSGLLRFTVTDCREDGGGKVARVELVTHARDQYVTKIMPVEYDPNATAVRFFEFLEQILPAHEMRAFIQRWFGLSMTGITGEQKFAFFYGNGANGKSVLMDLITRIFGDYGASAKIETLTGTNRRGGGDATPDLVPLIGARAVRTSEPDQGVILQEGLVKELTGGEPILVRALHSDFVLVYPKFKLTISGNHKPEIRGGDDGIWRRVMLVDFPVQIAPEKRIPKNELDEILWAERAGIFRWLVDGLCDFLESGLQIPKQVTDATQEYREDSDPFGTFLTMCCHVSGDHKDKLAARDLVEAFNLWLDDQGKGTFKPTTVSKRFAGMARKWKSPTTGKTFDPHKSSTMSYIGIAFAEPFGTRFREMPRDSQGRILRNGRTAEGSDQ